MQSVTVAPLWQHRDGVAGQRKGWGWSDGRSGGQSGGQLGGQLGGWSYEVRRDGADAGLHSFAETDYQKGRWLNLVDLRD